MAEIGDPPPEDRKPDPARDPDLDEMVGFASPRALDGRPRRTEAPTPAAEPPAPETAVPPAPAPRPADAIEAVSRPAPPAGPASSVGVEPAREFGRKDRDAAPEAPLGMHAVYALILFAVPTVGVSAVIGLLSVLSREPPADQPWLSHHVFQVRTLWTAAIAAAFGVVLIVVNLGVFVLFVLALWVLARGAMGAWRLSRGRPVPDPRSWWLG